MTVYYLYIYAINYTDSGSNWAYIRFSGAPVTGSGLGLGYKLSTQNRSCGRLGISQDDVYNYVFDYLGAGLDIGYI